MLISLQVCQGELFSRFELRRWVRLFCVVEHEVCFRSEDGGGRQDSDAGQVLSICKTAVRSTSLRSPSLQITHHPVAFLLQVMRTRLSQVERRR